VPHEVADRASIVLDGLGAFAVARAVRLDDRSIVTHAMDEPDKAVVEALDISEIE